MTYGTLISTQTIGAGGAASIDFNSIPQTYTDLVIVLSGRLTQAQVNGDAYLRVNGSTSGYSSKNLNGNGSNPGTFSGDPTTLYAMSITGANATANTFGNTTIYIPNYAGSTNKAISVDSTGENNGTTSLMNLNATIWANTAAITSISLWGAANYVQYSTASLYGIK